MPVARNIPTTSADLQQERSSKLRGTLTHAHLKASLASDAQTARIYAYVARVAEIEGYPDVARTLRELVELQVLLADGHVDFLKRAGEPRSGLELGETATNLRAIIAAEQQDATETLLAMARTADAEGFADIASWFETLVKAKCAHVVLLREALERMPKRSDEYSRPADSNRPRGE
ncbi:ferritin family protein [Sorangium sp. So ce1128]